MKLDIEGEDVCINRVLERKNENMIIESDVIIPDIKPDIISSIYANGNICIYKKEIVDGRVKIDGTIDTYIVYVSDTKEGEIRSINTKLDFSKELELSNNSSEIDLNVDLNLKSMDCNVINGRKVNIKAYIEASIKTNAKENIKILKEVKNINNLQKQNKDMVINSLIGKGTTKTTAKDTITINSTDNFAEILNAEISVINRDFKISYNKILAKAEVKTKIMYLTEDNRIDTVEKLIPVMGFVDIQDISEENFCDVKYNTRNIIIKPNDIEEHSIFVEIELEISSYVYENKRIALIQDLYSPEQNIEFGQRKVSAMSELTKSVNMCNVNKRIEVPEIAGNKIYNAIFQTSITNTTIENERIMYEGDITATILYQSSNSLRLESRVEKIPFNYEIDAAGITNIANIETEITIREDNLIVLSDGEVEVQVTLQLDTKKYRNMEINIIDNIETDELRNEVGYSIVIYFVKKGDTLWNIAKKFKSTVEDIVKVNDIENENMIHPGEQLLIPRYVIKKIG